MVVVAEMRRKKAKAAIKIRINNEATRFVIYDLSTKRKY